MSRAKTEALAGGAAQGFRWQATEQTLDCPYPDFVRQALRTIAAENAAQHYLARLRRGVADPDELAACIAVQYDRVALAGFCRVIAKALEVRHA